MHKVHKALQLNVDTLGKQGWPCFANDSTLGKIKLEDKFHSWQKLIHKCETQYIYCQAAHMHANVNVSIAIPFVLLVREGTYTKNNVILCLRTFTLSCIS